MHRTLIALIALLLVVATVAAPSTTASASAASEQSTLSCDFYFSAGTSDAPYVFIGVMLLTTWEIHYTTVPVIDGRFSGQITFPRQPEGTLIMYATGGIVATGPGYAGIYYDGGSTSEGILPCATPTFSGPGVPSGFVLKTITCDVAVFDAAGGNPVGDNALKMGQTWYVNPETQVDAAGAAWTEVFVSGLQNVYVPARCVN